MLARSFLCKCFHASNWKRGLSGAHRQASTDAYKQPNSKEPRKRPVHPFKLENLGSVKDFRQHADVSCQLSMFRDQLSAICIHIGHQNTPTKKVMIYIGKLQFSKAQWLSSFRGAKLQYDAVDLPSSTSTRADDRRN